MYLFVKNVNHKVLCMVIATESVSNALFPCLFPAIAHVYELWENLNFEPFIRLKDTQMGIGMEKFLLFYQIEWIVITLSAGRWIILCKWSPLNAFDISGY